MASRHLSYARAQRLARRRRAQPSASAAHHRGSAPDDEALRLLELVSQRDSAPASGTGNPSVAPTLAHTLGNRRFGQLTGQGPSAQAGHAREVGPTRAQPDAQPSPGLLRQAAESLAATMEGPHPDIMRDEEQDTPLTVNLTFQEQAMQRYQVSGATMEEVCEVLPDILGEFHHNLPGWTWDPVPGTHHQMGTVNIPVEFYYVMPQWTELDSQPPEIQAAWNSFYGDLFEHEQEHHQVCVQHYNELKDTIEALPPEDRRQARVQSEIDTSVEAQNEVHRNHTGFVTPSTFVCSDYIPEQETPPEGAGEEPETEPEPETGAE